MRTFSYFIPAPLAVLDQSIETIVTAMRVEFVRTVSPSGIVQYALSQASEPRGAILLRRALGDKVQVDFTSPTDQRRDVSMPESVNAIVDDDQRMTVKAAFVRASRNFDDCLNQLNYHAFSHIRDCIVAELTEALSDATAA